MVHSVIDIIFNRTVGRSREEFGSVFRISEIWSEVVEISESESFGGVVLLSDVPLLICDIDRSRKVYLEHRFHLLVLPGLHGQSSLNRSTLGGLRTSSHFRTSARLKFLGFLPSPFHFRLRVTSRFSFNDAGRVTYHRDLWDVKDIAQMLVPWSRPFIFVVTRIAGFLLGLLAASAAWWVNAPTRDHPMVESGDIIEPRDDRLRDRQIVRRLSDATSVDVN